MAPRTTRVYAGWLAGACFGAIVVLAGAVHSQEPPARKKLIALGWDSPTPAEFAAQVAEREAAGIPVDGTRIRFTARLADGRRVRPFARGFAGTVEELGTDAPLTREMFAEGIELMRGVSPRQVTDNFVRFNAQPGNVDWFDDAGWGQIVENFRHAAYAAKASGMKGLLFDPEPYTEPYAQFDYLRQPGYGERSFDDYRAMARERGRAVMRAMQSEFDDITVLMLFYTSYFTASRFRGPESFGLDNAALALPAHSYALLPAFIDGWLDVMGPDVTLVDGNEQAYYYNGQDDFERARLRLRQQGLDVVDPVNRARYARQVQVGAAVFMDAYQPDFPPQFSVELPPGVDFPTMYSRNIGNALRTTDEYVWLYNESGSFWERGQGGNPPWPEVFPWIIPATAAARDATNWPPASDAVQREVARELSVRNRYASWARARFESAVAGGDVQSANLLRNGSFDVDTEGWGYFQAANLGEPGSLRWSESGDAAPGAAEIRDSRNGSAFQSFAVSEGDTLWVRARFKRSGWAEPSVSFGWRDASNAFIRFSRQTLFAPAYESTAGSRQRETPWTTIEGMVRVPDGAVQAVFTLDAAGQRAGVDGDRDRLLYDDVVVLKVATADESPSLAPEVLDGALSNGGFEDGFEGWQLRGDWNARPDGDAWSGQAAAKLGPGRVIMTQQVAVSAGDTLTLRAFARRTGLQSRAFVGMRFVDGLGQAMSDGVRLEQVRGAHYAPYELSAQAPAGAAAVSVFVTKQRSGGYLLVDDVSLVRGN